MRDVLTHRRADKRSVIRRPYLSQTVHRRRQFTRRQVVSDVYGVGRTGGIGAQHQLVGRRTAVIDDGGGDARAGGIDRLGDTGQGVV